MLDDSTANAVRNLVSVQGGQVVTTSRIIAEAFGKSHGKVLRAIANLQCSATFREANFGSSVYYQRTPFGAKAAPEILLTRDGCMFLVMGFTGPKAAEFKEAFINAFNWMADLIRKRDELDWRIQDHTRRATRSANEGSYHGRGLAQRRLDKHTLAMEELQLRGEVQLNLFLTQQRCGNES